MRLLITANVIAGLALVATLTTPVLRGQAPAVPPAVPALITATFNAEFTVADAQASVAFYRDVLGFQVAAGRRGGGPPPAAAPPAGGAPAPAAPPAARQGGAGGAGRLTGAIGGVPRITRLVVPGASWQLEIIEMTNIERRSINPRRQDIGASGLILVVRDIDAMVASLKQANARILTTGGQPVMRGRTRSITAQDPDGFLLEVRQADPLPPASAPAASNVVGVGMTMSIRDTDETVRYWRDVLDFDMQPASAFSAEPTELTLLGTPGAQVRRTIGSHPGTPMTWEFLEFRGIDRRELMPRIQDPGNGAMIVLTQDMDRLVQRLKGSSLTKILSVGGEYVPRGVDGGAIFFQDMNGFILEGCKGC